MRLALAILVACTPAVGAVRQSVVVEVSIVDFGARGDGSDDRAAIQAALNAGAGGIVHVPIGRWTVGRAGSAYYGLAIPAGTTLLGEGRDSSVLVQAVVGPSVRLIEVATVGVTIQSLTLDGSRSAQEPNAQRHCLFARAPGLTVSDVVARDCSGDGLYLYGGAGDATIDGLVAQGNGRNGMTTVAASGLLVTGSTFAGNAAQQFDSEPGSPAHVDNVTLRGNTFDGIGVSNDYVLTICGSAGGRSTGWTVRDNTINGGIYIVWASDITIAGNRGFNPTSKPSVTVYRAAERVAVEGNDFASAAASSIVLVSGTGTGQAPSDVTIRSNRLAGGGAQGVFLSGALSVAVESNVITNSRGTGQTAIGVRATNPAVPFAHVVATGNSASGWSNGLMVAGVTGTAATLMLVEVRHNRLGGPMYLDEGSGALQRAVMSDNEPAEVRRWPAGAVLDTTVTMTRRP